MIGYDHPFADGNGRIARALFYWSMARSGYWLMEYTSISHILRKAPVKYMRAYRVDAHQRSHAVVYQTARNDLLSLEALGLLEKTRQGNAFVFYASTDLKERLNGLA